MRRRRGGAGGAGNGVPSGGRRAARGVGTPLQGPLLPQRGQPHPAQKKPRSAWALLAAVRPAGRAWERPLLLPLLPQQLLSMAQRWLRQWWRRRPRARVGEGSGVGRRRMGQGLLALGRTQKWAGWERWACCWVPCQPLGSPQRPLLPLRHCPLERQQQQQQQQQCLPPLPLPSSQPLRLRLRLHLQSLLPPHPPSPPAPTLPLPPLSAHPHPPSPSALLWDLGQRSRARALRVQVQVELPPCPCHPVLRAVAWATPCPLPPPWQKLPPPPPQPLRPAQLRQQQQQQRRRQRRRRRRQRRQQGRPLPLPPSLPLWQRPPCPLRLPPQPLQPSLAAPLV